jgi:gliding motility-associated-like protein
LGYPSIVWNEVTTKDASCFGFGDGTITVTAGEGMPPLVITLGTKQPVENIFPGLKAGKYTVTVTDSKNCKIDTLLTIAEPDKLVVNVSPNKNDCEGYDDGGAIISKVEGGTQPYNYVWSSNPPKYSADLTGMPNGAYQVIVKDAHDCTDSAAATIIYDNCCKTFVPDAFTPNNDGKNDKLHILFKGDLSISLFNIYSRFGQLVFTTTNINDGWDGTLNGEPQDIGTYNYYIKGICGNGGNKDVEYKGTVTLIR